MNYSGTDMPEKNLRRTVFPAIPGDAHIKSGSRTRFTDLRSVLKAQIRQCYQAEFLPNHSAPINENQYKELVLKWAMKSAPETLPKASEGCLPFVLILPREFVNCKRQMKLIEKARGGQIVFNEMTKTIHIRTDGKNITFQNVDFSTFYIMTGSNQPTLPYLIFSPPCLVDLLLRIDEFSPEEILAIIFHYTNALG